MKLDKTLAGLLSNFFLDIAKAAFIVTFITPPLSGFSSVDVLGLLTRGLVTVILCLGLSWELAKFHEHS